MLENICTVLQEEMEKKSKMLNQHFITLVILKAKVAQQKVYQGFIFVQLAYTIY